jgi:peptidyl-tRNA hydrolase, PTH1 family
MKFRIYEITMKKIIFGLGNPGKEYEQTRHNAGFLFLDYLQEQLSLPNFSLNKKIQAEVTTSPDFLLAKPQTFMNLSGEAVKKTLSYFCDDFSLESPHSELLSNLYVAHDDLDLELGQYKIQQGVGPKQHNGLLSIYQALDTSNFWHVRIGIDDRDGSRILPPEKYVLQKLSESHVSIMKEIFEKIVAEIGE